MDSDDLNPELKFMFDNIQDKQNLYEVSNNYNN